jgi:hypothetical protein
MAGHLNLHRIQLSKSFRRPFARPRATIPAKLVPRKKKPSFPRDSILQPLKIDFSCRVHRPAELRTVRSAANDVYYHWKAVLSTPMRKFFQGRFSRTNRLSLPWFGELVPETPPQGKRNSNRPAEALSTPLFYCLSRRFYTVRDAPSDPSAPRAWSVNAPVRPLIPCVWRRTRKRAASSTI